MVQIADAATDQIEMLESLVSEALRLAGSWRFTSSINSGRVASLSAEVTAEGWNVDAVLVAVKAVQHRKIAFARHAEDMARAMDLQLIDEDLAAGPKCHRLVLNSLARVSDTALAWPSKPS